MHRGYVGLSKKAVRHTGSRYSLRKVDVLIAGKQQARRKEFTTLRRAAVEGGVFHSNWALLTMDSLALSECDQDAIRAMDTDTNEPFNDADDIKSHKTVPPGDEGFDISHEGGEFEVFDELVESMAEINGHKRNDYRTRRDRVEILNENWAIQMPRLVDAYLDYQAQQCNGDPPGSLPEVCEAESCQVETFDIFSRRLIKFTVPPGMVFPNEALLKQGFLGTSPLQPTLAISLRTLAYYQQIHRTCPRISIQAQCKALCHLHKIPYKPYFTTQFSVAYDAYLHILRQVDCKVQDSLCRETPHWKQPNACPACFYKLEGEPELEFSLLCSIDGNNSLRRMADVVKNTTSRIDLRVLESDQYIKPQEVDRFKDEVQSHPRKKDADIDQDDWEETDIPDSLTKCVDRWRNAGPEQRKKMFSLFEETGIFLACCRHRFILLFCDMIKSGERAKYPLAIVDRLMDTYGPNIGCAYDIGCAFDTTLRNSSLGAKARSLNFRLMVGAFHGHAHNRLCQLSWHPLYIKGTGNSEGEGCEHIFSSSNDQARNTRHASRFHRLQAIQEHFSFWDEDKYALLGKAAFLDGTNIFTDLTGNFLFNHYCEALNTIHTFEMELDALRVQLGVSPESFEAFLLQEKTHIENLINTPPEVTLKVKYVHALDEFAKFSREWEIARAAANEVLTNVASDQIHRVLLEARKHVESAYAKLQNSNTFIFTLEAQLGIETRWEMGGSDYQKYKDEANLVDYRDSLNELERLVIQRLFELSKLSMSGTGYKLRSQIGKALQRRSEAIRNALKKYNIQAGKLDPPRPSLSWKEIVDYSFLAEFDLLRFSRIDIRQAQWTAPAYREGAVKYFKLCRAREEVVRLNIEICRLRTAIRDEEANTSSVIIRLEQEDLALCAEVQRRWILRKQVNRQIVQQLDKIEKLAGFSGQRGAAGVRLGMRYAHETETALSIPDGEDDEDENAWRNEEQHNHVEKMTTFMENISD